MSKVKGLSVFSEESDERVTKVVKQTMGVGRDEDGTTVVSFATNRGKGSGAQIIPANQYPDVLAVLRGYVDNGFPEGVSEEENLPAAEVIRRTIHVEDDTVSFRTRNGKGAKPARIPLDQFSDAVELLESTAPAIAKAAAKLK